MHHEIRCRYCPACLALTGCSYRNYSKSTTPANIQGEAKWESSHIWESTLIYRVGNFTIYGGDYQIGTIFTVDPGQQMILVWYKANRGIDGGAPIWQTDLVEFNANLKPNGKYQVLGDYGEKSVRFKLVDLDTQEVIVESSETPIIRRPTGVEPSPQTR